MEKKIGQTFANLLNLIAAVGRETLNPNVVKKKMNKTYYIICCKFDFIEIKSFIEKTTGIFYLTILNPFFLEKKPA